MYVCNCNGITERQVKSAIRAGAQRWKDVHAHHGVEPCCGQCQCEIVEAISEHHSGDAVDQGPVFGSPLPAGAY